jgi:HSP20 family protein
MPSTGRASNLSRPGREEAMEILGSDIFEQMARLQRELNELAFGVRASVFGAGEEELWRPPVDIREREDALVLVMDLPGLSREDIDLRVDGLALTIEGERKPKDDDGRSVRVERPVGKFRRSFRLGAPVDPSGVKASYRDGVLEVRLPKVGPSEPVRLEVEPG